MKTAIATTVSLAIAATLSVAAYAPANADTLRRVKCPDGRIVTASGTQTDAEACMMKLMLKPSSGSPASAHSRKRKIQATRGSAKKPFDNTAYAWTAACYAEFGPDAKYPDADLLDWCLNF